MRQMRLGAVSFARRKGALALAGVMVIAVLAVALGSYFPRRGGSAVTREFTVSARRFSYSPERLLVHQGDRVVIHLQPLDVTHGFYLEGYGIQTYATVGGESTAEFVADKPGMFRFRCSETCGPLHPFMVGQLDVQSGTRYTNTVFLATAAAALMVAVGTVVYVGRRGRASDTDS